MKIILALEKVVEGQALEASLESFGHRVLICRDLNAAAKSVRDWQPDVLVAAESICREEPDPVFALRSFAEWLLNGAKDRSAQKR